MTRHFPNHIFEKLTERDARCTSTFPGRDSPKLDRVFHESGHIRYYLTTGGQRLEEVACIHCGRRFNSETSDRVMRDGEVESRLVHTQEAAGSIPAPATNVDGGWREIEGADPDAFFGLVTDKTLTGAA